MDFNFTINTKSKIITVKTSGELIKHEMAEMDKSVRIKAKELNCKILFDFRQSQNRITLAEAFFWYKKFYVDDEIPLRYIPTAHLSNAKDEHFFKFFETTTNNNGIPIKMFLDEVEALDWLGCNRTP